MAPTISLLSPRAGDRIVRSFRKVTRIGLPEVRPVFLHIRKTAGTSLRRMIDRAYWGQPVLNVAGGGARRERVEQMSQSYLDRYAVYVGHFPPEFAERVRNPFLFTFLREPQDRLVSDYFYHRPGGWLPDTFEAFLDDDSSDNHITRALAGEASAERAIEALAAMDFVGFTETIEEDANELFRRLGKGDVTMVKTKITRDRPVLEDLPETVRQAVEHRTCEDRKVYDWAFRRRAEAAAHEPGGS